ncbi:DNA pilot protein [Dipodfec virus UOA04_Rod_1021]|nr:DNA pilot protein [Dipodfec virus UOA04_Rod_1021]
MGFFGNVANFLGKATGLGPIVNAVGSIGGALIGSNSSSNAVKQQNAGNMELAKYAYQQNLEQWNRENEYNTPANQIARLRAAGLNPNLMYGDSSAGGVSASSPNFNAPTLGAYTGQGAIGASIGQTVGDSVFKYLAAEKQQSENQLLKYQAQSEQMRTQGLAADLVLKGKEAEMSGMRNTVYGRLMDSVVRKGVAEAEGAEIGNTNARISGSLMASQIERNQAQTKQLQEQSKLTKAQAEQVVKKTENLTYEVALLVEKTKGQKLTNAQIAETNKYIGERLQKTIDKIDLDTHRGQLELYNLWRYGDVNPGSGANFIPAIVNEAAHRLSGN